MALIACDVCVIGAGSGGLATAYGASQMGAETVLVESHKMGGDCLNYGCVPSKALLAAAKQAHAMGRGAPYGVAPVAAQVDYAAAKDHVRHAIDTIAPVDSQERYEGLGVRVIRAHARFISPRELQAGEATIRARRFVIATGSGPLVPPIPGLDSVDCYTNETIFDLRERPDHLIVIGGGPIGMEMAQAHRRLGSDVTVIEGAKALGRDDPELAAILLERLRDEGVAILEDAPASAVSAGPGGAITVTTPQGDVTGSHLLVAVGRRVNVADMGLEAAGVAFDRHGVKVDAALRATNRRIYAVGDAAGGMQFTHLAEAMAKIREFFPGAKLSVREGKLHVEGSQEEHREISRLLSGKSMRRTTVQPGTKVYSAEAQGKPVGAIVLALGQKLERKVEFDPGLTEEDLTQSVSFSVKDKTLPELLQAALEPAGLGFELTSEVIKVRKLED